MFYFQVRDGAHGYSRLLGKYCGTNFPPMLTTTDRYMWLHFQSDENIEYQGFTIKFEFIPRPTQCKYQLKFHIKIQLNKNQFYN